jgi:hypothetical protein
VKNSFAVSRKSLTKYVRNRVRFFLFFALLLSVPAWAQDAHVQLVSLEGEGWVRYGGADDWIALEAGTPLEAGDHVRLPGNSRAELVTADGDALELQAESEMEVGSPDPKGSVFRLWLGGLLAKVTPSPDKTFRVQTPLAVAAVRGTEFAVDVGTEGESQIGVTEGSVAVQRMTEEGKALENEEVLVSAHQGANVRAAERIKFHDRLPALARKRLARMAVLRSRAPALREKWKRLPLDERRAIRLRLRERWQQMPPARKQRLQRRLPRRWQDLPPAKKREFRERRRSR